MDKVWSVGSTSCYTDASLKGHCAFEDEPCCAATLDDLDAQVLERYLDALGSGRDAKSTLEEQGFFAQGQLTKGAVILFARNPSLFIPCDRIHVSKFATLSHTDEPLCIRDLILDGPLPTLLEETEKTIFKLSGHVTFLDTDGVFKRVSAYPRQMWIDGLMGALMHRSYRSPSYIHVTVFNNRLQIVSPGTLAPCGNSNRGVRTSLVEDRNPRISAALHVMGYSQEIVEQQTTTFERVTSLEHAVFDELNILDGQSVRLTIKSNVDAWDQLLEKSTVDGRMLLSPIYAI
ncbi:MAG: ATP-binding protein [Atopobiaceae bacterium]|jgi:ATP-dependent DNA helicase RecG